MSLASDGKELCEWNSAESAAYKELCEAVFSGDFKVVQASIDKKLILHGVIMEEMFWCGQDAPIYYHARIPGGPSGLYIGRLSPALDREVWRPYRNKGLAEVASVRGHVGISQLLLENGSGKPPAERYACVLQ
jgi:hypothetical protein